MSFRTLNKFLVGLSLLACSSVFAAPIVVNIAGVQSVGLQGDPGNTIINVDVGAGVTITGVSYNINVTAFSPSWLSEIGLVFTDSDGIDGVQFNPGFDDDASGTATYADSADLVALGLDFVLGADGILRLEFFEGFDDGSISPDGVWNFGTITFMTDAVDVPPTGDVPEPATGMLMGAGLALMGYTARRRRNAAKAA